ncbi:MAG: aminodeoxychorismate synthase [Geminocystis sp.]|nr:aminodeoxychorismate synthase [Geminocystis sp.]MCS7146833.1 aminodeoxychorismate synthase [Geminocystis sp.]MDW8115658.1 aminodeoxychorismate synthase [Geminocystis sp.]MDW8463202.1 aminodeoxychorismate synthase [Geminocystis sp.]
MKTLIIDNYDSFTYNIYQLVAEINQENPIVVTNDQLSWGELTSLDFDNVIISPGPGNPKKEEDFGICKRVILELDVPILGVCLGHQGLAYYYGAKIVNAPEPYHGRISEIYHQQDTIFKGLPSPFKAVRYHSLIVDNDKDTFPNDLEIIATTNDGLIMAIKHKHKPLWGVQFHPESISSQFGRNILVNFQRLTLEYGRIKSGNGKHKYSKIYPLKKDNSSRGFSKLKLLWRKLDFFLDSEVVFDSLYSKSEYSFWLDSSLVIPGVSRFSYMGDAEGQNSFVVAYYVDSQQTVVNKNNKKQVFSGNILDFIQQFLDANHIESELPFDFSGGFVGYLGYELKSLCGYENNYENKNNSHWPTAQFIFPEKIIVFDHLYEKIYLLHLLAIQEEKEKVEKWFDVTEETLANLKGKSIIIPDCIDGYKPNSIGLSRGKYQYLKDIEFCLEKIREGESYEICLTNKIHLPPLNNPLKFYYKLRRENPAPYSCYLKMGNIHITCASPERFLRLNKDGHIESKPIKGTIRRSKNPEEDEELKKQLQFSEKEQAENLMIVDLLRNDLGKVCEIGSVHVPKLMAIESYSTVHQMVSTIRGKVRPDCSVTECIKACFPGGSMTGAPKKRTIEILEQLESEARGIYSGSIGFLGLNGTIDLNIVIRTAVTTPYETTIGVGGAITILSSPEKEFAETLLKASGLLEVAGFRRGWEEIE